MQHSLTIVMPSYNEGQSLKTYLPKVLEFCNRNSFKLIIVNDGSTDNTCNILKAFDSFKSFSSIKLKVNGGYGKAIKEGISSAESEYVITIDADGQHVLEDVLKLYGQIIEQDADMIIGSRKGFKDRSILRTLGKSILRTIAKMLMPIHIWDINSGMKIYRTDLAKKYLHLCPDSMAYSDSIALVFIHQRHLVLETPITILHREHGKSSINLRTAFTTLLEIINILMIFNPLKLFLPISIILFLSGIAWGLPIVLMHRGISIGASLSILVSVITFLIGLLAEQIAQIRKSQNE